MGWSFANKKPQPQNVRITINPNNAVIHPFDEIAKEDDPQLKAYYISKILLNPQFDIESMSNLEFHEKLNYPGVVKETAFALMDILKP